MSDTVIQIGDAVLNKDNIKSYQIEFDATAADIANEKAIKSYYQKNHYLGSAFSLLIAGVITTIAAKRKEKLAKINGRYLCIETYSGENYRFKIDEINIDHAIRFLGKNT